MHTNTFIGMCSLIFASVLPVQSGQAAPAQTPSYRSATIEDLAKFRAFPAASQIQADSDRALAFYFSKRGKYRVVSTDLENYTEPLPGQPQHIRLLSMVSLGEDNLYKTKNVVLVRFEMTVGRPDAQFLAEIPLDQTHWEAEVELSKLKVTLHERDFGITRTLPIAAGQLNNRENTSMHLIGKEGLAIDGSMMISRRDEEFLNYPFLRVSENGFYSTYGFHIDVDGPQSLRRKFSSHGCFRMNETHLMQLFLILKHQGWLVIPLTVSMRSPNAENIDSPWPVHPSVAHDLEILERKSARKNK